MIAFAAYMLKINLLVPCVHLQGTKELWPDPGLSAGAHGCDGHSGVFVVSRAQTGRYAPSGGG